MLRKLFTVTCLAALSGTPFLSLGCASSNAEPSALTGDQTTANDNWRYVDHGQQGFNIFQVEIAKP